MMVTKLTFYKPIYAHSLSNPRTFQMLPSLENPTIRTILKVRQVYQQNCYDVREKGRAKSKPFVERKAYTSVQDLGRAGLSETYMTCPDNVIAETGGESCCRKSLEKKASQFLLSLQKGMPE